MKNPLKRTKKEEMEEEPASEAMSDANTMVEEPKQKNEDPSEAGLVAPEDQLGEGQYPKGFQFFFILVALVLSIFIVALDLVCPVLQRSLTTRMADLKRRRSLQPQSPRSQTNFTVSLR